MNQAPIETAGVGRGTFGSYAAGFILSIILTLFSFALVIKGAGLPHWAILTGIFCAAVIQIIVHLHYFLHLDTSSSMAWNVMALIFTIMIMTLFVGGSLWIMFDLNHRMM